MAADHEKIIGEATKETIVHYKCILCGAFDPELISEPIQKFECHACGRTFLHSVYLQFVAEHPGKTLRQLTKEIAKNDSPSERDYETLIKYAEQIKTMIPDDPQADFYISLANKQLDSDSRSYKEFLRSNRVKKNDDPMFLLERIFYFIKYDEINDINIFIDNLCNAAVIDGQQKGYWANKLKEETKNFHEREIKYGSYTRDVFVCYAEENRIWAEIIVKALESKRIKVWCALKHRDKRNPHFWQDIQKNIEKCRIFLVVSSKEAMLKDNVHSEMEYVEKFPQIQRLEFKIDAEKHTDRFEEFFNSKEKAMDCIEWIDAHNLKDSDKACNELVARVRQLKSDSKREQTTEKEETDKKPSSSSESKPINPELPTEASYGSDEAQAGTINQTLSTDKGDKKRTSKWIAGMLALFFALALMAGGITLFAIQNKESDDIPAGNAGAYELKSEDTIESAAEDTIEKSEDYEILNYTVDETIDENNEDPTPEEITEPTISETTEEPTNPPTEAETTAPETTEKPTIVEPITIAPKYEITLTPFVNKKFDKATEGYGRQQPFSVVVSNTGNQPTGKLTIEISGTNSESFALSATSIDSLPINGNSSFTVVPKTGLTAGTYTATIRVSGGANMRTNKFNVTFTVTEPEPTTQAPTTQAPTTQPPTTQKPTEPTTEPPISTITIQGEEYSTDLTRLDLSERKLTDSDIASLKHMTNLTTLHLYGNEISDISALKGLTNLTELDLRGNPISGAQVAELRAALPNCSISAD